jgi:hypothetical protein
MRFQEWLFFITVLVRSPRGEAGAGPMRMVQFSGEFPAPAPPHGCGGGRQGIAAEKNVALLKGFPLLLWARSASVVTYISNFAPGLWKMCEAVLLCIQKTPSTGPAKD